LSAEAIFILIKGADKKAVKKILFGLTKDIIIYCIKQKIMNEFLEQKLDIKYQKKIEEWFIHLDQKEFGYKLNKLILKEVNRYMATKKTTEEIVNEMVDEPDWMEKIEKALLEKNREIITLKNLILSFA